MTQLKKVAFAMAAVLVPITGASAQVVVSGTDAGAFTNAVVPTNAGRAAGAFWDNSSADGTLNANNCNIGFYAVGTQPAYPTCKNHNAATFANQGGVNAMTKYWGNSNGANPVPPGRDPAAFMFAGGNTWLVTLIGAVSGNSSEMGWFTSDGGTYVFNPVTNWGNKTINTAISITSASNWGFYVRNGFNLATGGCFAGTTQTNQYDCSDATGGWAAVPFQQFALFTNAGGTRYLVGTEDNALELYGQNPAHRFRDSDYNDYIFSVENQTPFQSVVPEPLTMGLLATGLVGLAGAGLVRRRRKVENN